MIVNGPNEDMICFFPISALFCRPQIVPTPLRVLIRQRNFANATLILPMDNSYLVISTSKLAIPRFLSPPYKLEC
jgi:hypothetical protein